MKKLLFALLVLALGQMVHAQSVELPPAQIDSSVLGGDVILIKMKDYLTISGAESQKLAAELGEQQKSKFIHDLVVSASLEDMVKKYQPLKAKPFTRKIISRYADILLKIQQAKTLNQI